MEPTGTLTILEVLPDGVLAQVEAVYARMGVEDRVRSLPVFSPVRSESSRAVVDGPSFAVIGFAEPHPVRKLGEDVFLEVGPGEGVRPGDVLEIVPGDDASDEDAVNAVVQVISVGPDHATARITALENPEFRSGVVSRLSRRTP